MVAPNSYIIFELNCNYYVLILYKKDISFCFKSKLVDKFIVTLKKL